MKQRPTMLEIVVLGCFLAGALWIVGHLTCAF
jgi:hypothetical protein